jgi:flagellar basal body-associated protein FliL
MSNYKSKERSKMVGIIIVILILISIGTLVALFFYFLASHVVI